MTEPSRVRVTGPLVSYAPGFAAELSRQGVAVPPSPAEALLERFRCHLVSERGLRADTARGYVALVRPFAAEHATADVAALADLTSTDVSAFVLATCRGRSVGSAKLTVTALRSLLRFLHVEGFPEGSLSTAVPSIAGWRLAGLPRGLEPEAMRALVAGCDRSTAVGRRDYAILMLLTRLALRAGELARLQLDDVDWRAGELVIPRQGRPSGAAAAARRRGPGTGRLSAA